MALFPLATRAAQLRPYRWLIGTILLIDVAVLLLAAWIYVGPGPAAQATARFLFEGFSATQLLIAGFVGLVGTRRAPHRAFWRVLSGGLLVLAVDNYVDVHEHLGKWLTHAAGIVPSRDVVASPDDLLTIAYGVVGVLLLVRFRRALRVRSAAITLLYLAVGFSALMLVCDSWPQGRLEAIEQPAQLLGGGFFLLTMAIHTHTRVRLTRLPGHGGASRL